jgi:hypothetical protein
MKRLVLLPIYLMPIILVVSLGIFIFSYLPVYHFHESAYTVPYGENILNNYLVYSETFSGREVSLINWALVSALLIPMFGVGIKTLVLSSLFFIIFYILVAFAFKYTLKINHIAFSLFLTLSFCVFENVIYRYRWFDQVWIWPMNSYGIYDVFRLLLSIFFILSIKRILEKREYLLCNYILFFLVFIFSCNGIRGVTTIVLPVILSYLFLLYGAIDNKKFIYNFMLLLIATFFGLLINKFLGQNSFQPTQEAHQFFSQGLFSTKIISIIDTWLKLFGTDPASRSEILSFYGIELVSKFILALIILVLPCITFRFKFIGIATKFFSISFLILLVIISIAFIFGQGNGQERYFIPLAYAGFFSCTCFFSDIIQARIKKYYYIIGLVILLLLPVIVKTLILENINTIGEKNIPTLFSDYNFKKHDVRNNFGYRMSEFLTQNNLTEGFIAPWSSDGLTVRQFSDSAVNIGLLEVHDLEPHWHSDDKWYEPRIQNTNSQAHQFLAIKAKDVAKSMRTQALIRHIPNRLLHFEDWNIYVFQGNLSKMLGKIANKKKCNFNFIKSTSYKNYLIFSIAGFGSELSCDGWANAQMIDNIYYRKIEGKADFKIAYKKGQNLYLYGHKSPKSKFSLYVNNEPYGTFDFSSSDRLLIHLNDYDKSEFLDITINHSDDSLFLEKALLQ